jgi:hypothetical protein
MFFGWEAISFGMKEGPLRWVLRSKVIVIDHLDESVVPAATCFLRKDTISYLGGAKGVDSRDMNAGGVAKKVCQYLTYRAAQAVPGDPQVDGRRARRCGPNPGV